MPTFLVSIRAKFKWLYTQARAALAGLAALSVIPAIFSLFATLLQQHLEHNFSKTSQSLTLLQQRIDKKNQLLGDFVATSNELLAVRSEASMSRASGIIRSQTAVICAHLRSLGKLKKVSAETVPVDECRDKDWDDDTRKQNDTTWGLVEKANEKNARLQSLAASDFRPEGPRESTSGACRY